MCGTDGEGQYGCPVATADQSYVYDSKGALASVTYPGQVPVIYGSDWAGRHVSLSRTGTYPWGDPVTTMLVKNATFDPAGRLTSLQTRAGGVAHTAWIWMEGWGEYGQFTVYADAYETETRNYNAMGQMTSQAWAAEPVTDTWGGPYSNPYAFAKTITYNYPAAGANNGQLASMSDGTGGETVAYQYDALKRLVSAAATPNSGGPTAWTETYGFDGFGNLTSKVLNGTTASIAVDGATNRLSNASYDANGNMTSGADASLGYDVANRLKQVSPTSGGTEYYGYAPDNKRVFRVKADGTEEWTLFGIGGEKIGTYVTTGPQATYNFQAQWMGQTAAFAPVKVNVWFDGRLVSEGGVAVYSDRLGTNRASGARFRPYGDEIGGVNATANDRVKFGTYTRDGFSGLDYADQRFYASTYGRFNTADPSTDNLDSTNPLSWNAYTYTNGDPVNGNDPDGLASCGDIKIVGGTFNGRTVKQVMTGTDGEDLLAQSMWLEAGTIYSSDLASPASVAAYARDLLLVGSTLLNQWDVDNHRLTVYQNGSVVCPLGQCLNRSLKSVILALEKDRNGAIFSSSGQMRSTEASKLKGILDAAYNAGPLVQDASGAWVNQGCEGVLTSLASAGSLLDGASRYGPPGLTLLYWNRTSVDDTHYFPGNSGYTGWRDERGRGQTYWGLPSTPTPQPKGPGGIRGR